MSEQHASMAAKALARKGGLARAQKMSPEDRAASAKAASEERWAKERGIPKATHEGEVTIGDLTISCANLEDGTRVFSERTLADALGRVRSGNQFAEKMAADDGAKIPVFMLAKQIKPYISGDLAMALSSPLQYRSRKGGRPAHGIRADLLPEICETWLKARDAGALSVPQMRVAEKAEILMRGLARVGVVALVDEATGFQAERARDELQRLLATFVTPVLRPWVQRFPDEFFREVYRLQGWKYVEGNTNGPRYVGKLINDYVYERLPPGVLPKLREVNPVVSRGQRRAKHHQHLTGDVGDPTLTKVVASVTTLMKASTDKEMFEMLINRAMPKPMLSESDDGQTVLALE